MLISILRAQRGECIWRLRKTSYTDWLEPRSKEGAGPGLEGAGPSPRGLMSPDRMCSHSRVSPRLGRQGHQVLALRSKAFASLSFSCFSIKWNTGRDLASPVKEASWGHRVALIDSYNCFDYSQCFRQVPTQVWVLEAAPGGHVEKGSAPVSASICPPHPPSILLFKGEACRTSRWLSAQVYPSLSAALIFYLTFSHDLPSSAT